MTRFVFRQVGRIFGALYRWLIPVHAAFEGEQPVLIYTSFPKEFYLYLVWLSGFVLLALTKLTWISQTTAVWGWILFGVLTYVTIVHDMTPKALAWLVSWAAALVVLYGTGGLNWSGIPKLVAVLEKVTFVLDAETFKVINVGIFAIWCMIYLYSVTWRKRELSSLRRAKLRPPFGKKPLPIVGLIVDPDIGDILEFVLGFGSYDVKIEQNDGRTIDIDRDCIGLWFYLRLLNDIIMELDVNNAPTTSRKEHEQTAASHTANASHPLT